MSREGPEREGVTKFVVHHTAAPAQPLPALDAFIDGRARLVAAGFIGADPSRYGGIGFGNLSVRAPGGAFWITGTQTGGAAAFGAEHLCLVERADPMQNAVWSRGPVAPSSEAMTHAVVYAARPEVGAVIHGHDPAMWAGAAVPATAADVRYGTPEMAAAVRTLLHDDAIDAFTMAGHEDGFVVFGATLEAAMERVLRLSCAVR